jgi:GR25 family glycosyltransferase involved in LPS biosynthesis
MPPIFDATYVINLDRSPDRWAHIQRVAVRAGLTNVVRVSGVDGALLDDAAIAALQRDGALASDLSRFSAAAQRLEIGCAISHARALAEFVASGLRTALILEDDVDLVGDTASWGLRLAAARADLAESWDVWYLYRCFDIRHRVRRLTARTVIPYTPQGGAAYAVTARGAATLLAALSPIARPVDNVYMDLVRSRALSAFAASPMLIDPGHLPSLINERNPARAWVANGVNRPPEYWPERQLAHLGERAPWTSWPGRIWRRVESLFAREATGHRSAS